MTSDFIINAVGRQCTYRAIAYQKVVISYPDYDAAAPMAIHEKFGYVTVYYPLRVGTTGGSPEVDIQRYTCKILRVRKTQ